MRRLHLLCAVLALVTLPARSQDTKNEDECRSIGLRSENFYKVTKLRQFPTTIPQWVKFQNDNMYYNLNGNTFKVAEIQTDDMAVTSKIKAPNITSVKDTNGNNIYQNETGIFAYLAKTDKEFQVNIDDETSTNDYRFIMDPISQIVFIFSKTKSGIGPLFWLSTRRPGNLSPNIPTNKIALFGSSITSMHFNEKTRDILLGAKMKRAGIVYLLKHSPTDPCGPSTSLEEQVLHYLNETFAAYEKTVLKKGGSDQRFTCTNSTAGGRRGGKENANERACNRLKNYTNNQHSQLTSIVNMLIDSNKDLQKQLEEQKLTILDAVGKLNRLSQTAILNKGAQEPIFKEQLSPTDVDEYRAHKYICVTNEEFEKGKKELDISLQLDYLKDSISMVKDELAGEPKLEDLFGDIFGKPNDPESSSDPYDIFNFSAGAEVQSDSGITDPPHSLNPSIDVRTKDGNL